MNAAAAVTRLSARPKPRLHARVQTRAQAGAVAFNEAMCRLDTSLAQLVDAGEAHAASARAAWRAGVGAFRAEWDRQRRRHGLRRV